MGCIDYSSKFYGMVERKRNKLPLDQFKQWLGEKFSPSSAQLISDAIDNGDWCENFTETSVKTQTTVVPKKEYSDEGFFTLKPVDRTSLSFYSTETTEGRIAHNKMINSFKKNIIKRLIYDYETKTSPDLTNDINGVSPVNKILFDYKMELMKNIWKVSGSNYDQEYIDDKQFTKQVALTLADFERKLHRSEMRNAYESYVILKNFDNLLKNHIDVISIDSAYDGNDYISRDMYTYSGPTMKRDASIGKESADANDYTGSIVKTLLNDYFPEVVNGKVDETLKIGLVGFNRVMTHVIEWVENSRNKTLINELSKGADTNWEMILDKYSNTIDNSDSTYMSILKSKLDGIRTYIFAKDANLPYDIKNSFNRHVRDVYGQNYSEYVFERNSSGGNSVRNSITNDYFVDVQLKNILRVVQSKVDLFRTNKSEFDEFCKRNHIEISDDSIKFNSDGIKTHRNESYEVKVIWDQKEKRYQFNKKVSRDDVDNNVVANMLTDLLDFVIPDDFENILKSIGGSNLFNTFFTPIMTTIAAGSDKFPEFKYKWGQLLDTYVYSSDMQSAGKFFAQVYGGETLNVVKNKEGNNLPLYSIGSAVRKVKQIINDVSGVFVNAYSSNVFKQKPFLLGRVITRSQTDMRSGIKSSKDNSIPEIAAVEVIHDFHENLFNNEGKIWLQPICYADKSTHTMFEVDTSNDTLDVVIGGKNEKISIHSALKDVANGLNVQNIISAIEDRVFKERQSKLKYLAVEMINRYSRVFVYHGLTNNIAPVTYRSPNDEIKVAFDNIRNIIKAQKDADNIRSLFKEYNENKEVSETLIENYDFGTGVNGKIDVNLMLLDDLETYLFAKDDSVFKNRLKDARRLTAQDYWEQSLYINGLEHVSVKENFFTDRNKVWYDSTNYKIYPYRIYDSKTRAIVNLSANPEDAKYFFDEQYTVELNPIFNSHFLMKLLYGNPMKELLLGSTYAYNSKASFTGDPNKEADVRAFKQQVRAAKIIEETKRALYCGATTTTYLQGLSYGVPATANVACVSDLQGLVFNPKGDRDRTDVHDGSGWVSPYWAIQTNESLADASVGWSKKTIYGHIDPVTGVFTEIKWAEFPLSNQYRKNSPINNVFSAEKMFEKMHNQKIPNIKWIDFNITDFYSTTSSVNSSKKDGVLTHKKPVYYFDYNSGKYYEIISVSNSGNLFTKNIQEVNEKGVRKGEVVPIGVTINSLYDLDQFFGGAFCKEKDVNTGYLIDSDINNYLVNNVICENDLKDFMIHIVANKSAIKVGQKNLNAEDIFSLTNKDRLQTFQISTKYGGVIMDADHEIEDSEVREMGQLVSALMQEGNSAEAAKQIYQEIGEVVYENVKKYIDAKNNVDKTELYNKLGDALLQAFATQERDVIGLAQAFISKFEQGDQKYQIPFSSATVAPAFMSAISSVLTKQGIRRTFPGVGAVQVPSRGVMMTYKLGNLTYDFEGAVKLATSKGVNVDIASANQFENADYSGIDLIFKKNPQLAAIGSKYEYFEYLRSIFPNSQITDIYWHGSDSDFSKGLSNAEKSKGSGSPHITGEFYLAKQPWSVAQYVSGINRNIGPDKNGFNHWNKLWWELKEIMSNGRRENNKWKDLIISDNIRQAIPNKAGVFNRDTNGENGKWLSERKADYGYENKTDEEFFKDVFGIEWGKDTFNTWTKRNEEVFKNINISEINNVYPVLINVQNPIIEEGQNTYYEPERGLLTLARENNNDVIISNKADNEFGSDIAVVMNPNENMMFLGTDEDVARFVAWKNNIGFGSLNPFIEQINPEDIDFEDTLIIDGQLIKIADIKSYDYYRNVYKQPILRHNFQPRDLLAPVPKFKVNGKIYSIYDLDAVRICNYIGSLLSKKVKTTDADIANFASIFENPEAFIEITNNEKALESLLVDYQKEAYSIIRKLSEIQKNGFGSLPMQKCFGLEGAEVNVEEIITAPGQIIMGKAYANKLGIDKYHNIVDIKATGPNFFEKKLRSNLSLPGGVDRTKYDAVAYLNDGSKVLILIGDGFTEAERLGETVSDTTFKEVNGVIYKNNSEEICEASDIECRRYTDENGHEYSIFVIKSLDVLDKLNESKIIDSIRYNYTVKNYRDLMFYNHGVEINEDGSFSQPLDLIYPMVDPITRTVTGEFGDITFDSLPEQDLVNRLRQDELATFEKKIRILTNRKYDAFMKSLRFIGTRIPAQSMQSFMPLEVACFTNSVLNDVYVPHTLTWVAGSDYDIDKLYMMGYSLTNSGELFSYSGLSDYYSIDDVLKLPEPKGRVITESFETSTNHVSKEELIDFVQNKNLSAISRILNSSEEGLNISFENIEEIDSKQFGIWKRRFLKTLKTHERSKLNPNSRTSALKNRIVSQIESLMLDPVNIVNMLNPISMDNAKDAAKKTTLGNREKLMNYDVPTSMMIMQYQNMLGKNVIGSAASGLKAYFGELTYFNNIVEEIYKQIIIGDNHQNIFENIKRIVFDGKYKSNDIRILANTPLRKLISVINSKPEFKTLILNNPSYNTAMQGNLKEYITNNILDFEKLLIDLERVGWEYNTAQNISEILSAATDNAKELILAKINATLEFSDIYTYLITTGVSIPEIADFMTSPIFNIVSKFAKSDIFATSDRFHNLDRTIEFVKDKNTLFTVPGLNGVLKSFVSEYIKKNPSAKKDAYELLRTDVSSRDALVKYLAEKCKKEKGKLNRKNYNEFGEYQFDYESMMDTMNPEDVAPVKPKTTYHEYVDIYNYVTKHLIPKNEMLDSLDYKSSIQTLDMLEKILNGVSEQKAIAAFFSINKGIQTKDWDEYNWIEKQNKNINKIYIDRKLHLLQEQPVIKFDFVKFTKNPEYRRDQIAQFEKVKTTFNVLDVITNVDHFWEMLKLVGINRDLVNVASVYRLEREIEKELLGKTDVISDSDTRSVPNKDWRSVSNYTRDVITLNWFMRQPDLTISIPEGWEYYAQNLSGIREAKPYVASEKNTRLTIPLNTQEGIATFKRIVENNIIPALKNDPDFRDNMFIQHLRRSGTPDSNAEEFIRKYAFPFSLTNIEKGSTFERLYEDIVKSFNRDMYKDVGAKFGIGSWSLGDLFFVYNLIVNKEGFGKSSMTKIFEDSINYGNEVKTAESYYNYIKMIDSEDFKLSDLKYDIDDLKMRLAESSSAYNYGVELDKTNKLEPKILITKGNGKYSIPVLGRNLSDFTFNMWQFGSKGYEILPSLPGISIQNFNKMYEPNLDDNEVLSTIVDLMVERIGNTSKIPIKRVTTADIQAMKFKGEMQFPSEQSFSNAVNANSFIHNGVVYINTDNAKLDTPIHEFMHIICAGLKFNRRKAVRELYYKLLNDIAGTKGSEARYYKDLGNEYSDKHGSDLKEEVLVRALADKFKNEFTANWSNLLLEKRDENGNELKTLYSHQLKQAIIETLNETLGTTIDSDIKEDELGNYTLEQALVLFKSKLFELGGDWLTKTSISNNQTIATIKDRLIKTGDLKIGENC